MRAIIIAVILLSLAACVDPPSQPTLAYNTSGWVGKSADLLIQEKGSPNLIMPGEHGNTLFIYHTEVRQPYPTSMSNPTVIVGPKGHAIAANVPPNATNTASFPVLVCSTTYEVNKQHIVVSVKKRGPRCDE